MEHPRPYDRVQPSQAVASKSPLKTSSRRTRDALTVDVTRSPTSSSRQSSKLTAATTTGRTPSHSNDNDDDTLMRGGNRRNSQRVESWLSEQQRFPPSTSRHSRSGSDDSGFWQPPTPRPTAPVTPSNPYPANPHSVHQQAAAYPAARQRNDDAASFQSYVIVEEDATPTDDMRRPTFQINGHDYTPPATPDTSTSTYRNNATATRSSLRPWRNIHLPMSLPARPSSTDAFRSGQHPPHPPPPPSTPVHSTPESARTARQNHHFYSSRQGEKSITPKASRHKLMSLTRSNAVFSSPDDSSPRPSISTSSAATSTLAEIKDYPTLQVTPEKPASSNKFRSRFAISLSRASQRLGASYAPGHSDDSHHLERAGLESPSKSSFVSQDATTSRSTLFDSTPTFSTPSQSDNASYMAPSANINVKESVATLKKRTGNIFKEMGNNASSSALSIGRGNVFSSSAKRKKLVVSGVARGNTAAVEGLRKWCETFGEIRQISRMINGDLHVDFKRAEVADTVCRISAQVFIDGVGSVFLSWCSGKKS